jgi:DNA-binding MarR family transcriptional regulator
MRFISFGSGRKYSARPRLPMRPAANAPTMKTTAQAYRHFGLMRVVAVANDLSQQALGDRLHIPASSIVALLDQLEAKGLVRRRPDPADRRVRLVELTEPGRTVLARAFELGIGIEVTVCQGFDVDQREGLLGNLEKVARNIGLTLGVHPGFDGTEKEAGPPRRRPVDRD